MRTVAQPRKEKEMKHETTKRFLAAVLVSLLILNLFTGCSRPTDDPADTSQNKQNESSADSTDMDADMDTDTNDTSDSGTRTITDMAGREVTIPSTIDSVFSTGSVAAIYLYTLAPDRLLGWNYELNNIEKSVILEKYHSLPNFGMGDSVNFEAVIAAEPDIALNVGTINDGIISESDQISESLGIPVVVVDGDLLSAPESYRFMGELFGVEEDAEKLASYAESTFDDIAGMDIPEDKKVRIYYGNGEDSLETAPAGSSHGQIIDLVNAVNVAELEMGDGSRVQISAEQLLAWNPDVIVVIGEAKADISGKAAASTILDNPDYASLKAVQEQKVYGAPNAPFSWMDRPPGPNRIVGIRWLSGLIYPEYLNFDVDEEVREFFRLFYHVDLTDEQLENVYNGNI